MGISAYQYRNPSNPSDGYATFVGAYQSNFSDSYQEFDLYSRASLDANLYIGANYFPRSYYFTFDITVISDISDAINLQSYGGVPGKYRLGEIQLATLSVVSESFYVNFLSQYVTSVGFFAGRVSPWDFFITEPIVGIETDEILIAGNNPNGSFAGILPRQRITPFSRVILQPSSGVKMKVVAGFTATTINRGISPGRPTYPFVVSP